MKLIISIQMDNEAFEEPGELSRILSRVERKVEEISSRNPNCICNAPEISDKLLDINGNTVGTITVIDEEKERERYKKGLEPFYDWRL